MADKNRFKDMNRAMLDTVEVRDIDEDNRTATFIAATEAGVDTFWGPEHLRIPGIRLERFRKNPVVLDTHDRKSVGNIVGRAIVKAVNRTLETTITFAPTERAEVIWTLVKGGFARALSIGFIPDRSKIKELDDGETDGEGPNMITGPATIIRQWELLEISVVPVPADMNALRRAMLDGEDLESMIRNLSELLTINREKEAEIMPKNEEGVEDAPKNDDPKVREEPKVESAEEIDGRTRAAINTQIRDICPEGLERTAEDCILEKLNVEDARKRLLEERAKQSPPAGTPEPEDVSKSAEKKRAEDEKKDRKIGDISDDEFKRGLTG